MRALPRDQAARHDHGHLQQSAPQAASGLEKTWHVSPESNLPNQKRLEIGLTYIYGIGPSTAREILAALGLSPDEKIKDLTDEEVTKLQRYIDENYQVEGDLRRERQQAIKRLTEIGAYRGLRHRRGLPVNGQRTPGPGPAPSRGPDVWRRADLERRFARLGLEEDFLYAYGFMPRDTVRLLHPRDPESSGRLQVPGESRGRGAGLCARPGTDAAGGPASSASAASGR